MGVPRKSKKGTYVANAIASGELRCRGPIEVRNKPWPDPRQADDAAHQSRSPSFIFHSRLTRG